ncbi:sulfatase-like hydrolase/transferase, partial [Geminicoccus flavidas]|uniref:sulfatase-like hydrolase/transferase n=1 Tax=Geminicoccus flavidas TaxID=2506407 RepID=UPI00135BF1BE
MKRRDVVKTSAAAGLMVGLSSLPADAAAGHGHHFRRPPNILFVLVDQLRFPKVFPEGVQDAGQFFARFMPNLHRRLWSGGVKFSRHFSAACACTPSRGVLISGLYSQQSWLAATILATPDARASISPVLNRAYPTYGKLLRRAGYRTPYIGKWHVSLPPESTGDLSAYGFEGLTEPDPTGSNLQGTVGNQAEGYLNDQYISDQAVAWLGSRKVREQPWCLTVSFVNPHDKEFFWAGTEFRTFNNLYDGTGLEPFRYYSFHDGTVYPPLVRWADNPLKSPGRYGYPPLPPNWESAARIEARKPPTQAFTRLFQQFVWGGVADDSKQRDFGVVPYPVPSLDYGVAYAPHRYWERNLDSYTQIMGIVDQRIGEVLAALPKDVARDTVIVFTSDHGEYAGAHGFVSGKVGTLYDEAFHVPLIVVDPTGRFAGDIDEIRTGLSSSVDLLPLLVSIGHHGSRRWLRAGLAELYGQRHDMLPMLRSAKARGRRYVLLATDEQVPGYLNPEEAPLHLVGVRTQDFKLGLYTDWRQDTTRIDRSSIAAEFYDYTTARGRAELDNQPDDPRALAARR